MTYAYYCNNCEKAHDIVKPMAQADKTEHCPKCKEQMQRVFKLHGIKTGDGLKYATK